jgi:hypothetical protein
VNDQVVRYCVECAQQSSATTKTEIRSGFRADDYATVRENTRANLLVDSDVAADDDYVNGWWRAFGHAVTVATAGLVVRFTVHDVSGNGVGITAVVCALGLLPVLLLPGATAGSSRVFLILMIVLASVYTGYWIYGMSTYDNYTLGAVDFVVIPVEGVITLGLPLAIYWIARTSRLPRTSPDE